MSDMITIALSKGRLADQALDLLEASGYDCSAAREKSRRLILEDEKAGLRFIMAKPADVPTYVEYGTADLGISGRDTLLERRYDLYQPLDLKVGRCRMVVATVAGRAIPELPRIATKFARIATDHFASKGVQAEVIYVSGSVELAPLVGLADAIVDLVESGATLRENNLVETETICEISSVLVANRSLFKLRHAEIAPLLEKLRGAIG